MNEDRGDTLSNKEIKEFSDLMFCGFVKQQITAQVNLPCGFCVQVECRARHRGRYFILLTVHTLAQSTISCRSKYFDKCCLL